VAIPNQRKPFYWLTRGVFVRLQEIQRTGTLGFESSAVSDLWLTTARRETAIYMQLLFPEIQYDCRFAEKIWHDE
jgi:hypothetical protein